jgi:putative copper resistance protein D
VDELIVAARGVHFTAVVLLFGAPMFRLCVEPRGRDAIVPVPAIALSAAVVALLSALGWFVGLAAELAGDWSEAFSGDTLSALTFDTRFGRLWIARLALIVAIIGLCAVRRWSRRKDIALLVLSVLVTASLAGVGHGMEGRGALAPLHALADMVHLLCAATWVGGLFVLALALRRFMAGGGNAPSLRLLLLRFSRLGYGAVALLVLSGCINALILVPLPEALITTTYGRVLSFKIGLAVLMIALAVVNRLVLVPRIITSQNATGALWRSVVAEQAVGLAILATVAWLGTIHSV